MTCYRVLNWNQLLSVCHGRLQTQELKVGFPDWKKDTHGCCLDKTELHVKVLHLYIVHSAHFQTWYYCDADNPFRWCRRRYRTLYIINVPCLLKYFNNANCIDLFGMILQNVLLNMSAVQYTCHACSNFLNLYDRKFTKIEYDPLCSPQIIRAWKVDL